MSDSHNKTSQTLKSDFFKLQQSRPPSFPILLLCFSQFIRLASLEWSLTLSPSLPLPLPLRPHVFMSLRQEQNYMQFIELHSIFKLILLNGALNKWGALVHGRDNYGVCKWPRSRSYRDLLQCHCSGDGATLTQKQTIIQFYCPLLLY